VIRRGVRPASGQSSRTAEVPYVQPAARQQAAYLCARGHLLTVPFAAGADIPTAWDCRCGAPASRPGSGQLGPAVEDQHDRRMAQVFDRRTVAELEELLAERLAETGARRKGGGL
jgi:hypothetical protein